MNWNNNLESEEELQRILDSLTVRLVRKSKDMSIQEFGVELSDTFYDYMKENYKLGYKKDEMLALYERIRTADYYDFYKQAVAQITSGKAKK